MLYDTGKFIDMPRSIEFSNILRGIEFFIDTLQSANLIDPLTQVRVKEEKIANIDDDVFPLQRGVARVRPQKRCFLVNRERYNRSTINVSLVADVHQTYLK